MMLFRQSVAHHKKTWLVALAVVFVLGIMLSTFAVVGGPLGRAGKPAYGATLGTGGGTAQTSSVVQPIRATIQWSKTPPVRSAAEQQAEARALALHNQLKAPPVGPHPAASQVADPRTVNAPLSAPKPAALPVAKPGQTAQTAPGGAQADSDFVNENFSYATSGVCPTDCATSDVAETSVGNDGKHIMLSGNWFDAVSHDNASTWGYIDPYTLFGGFGIPFCCDQQVVYEPSRDLMWWEALGFNGTYGSTSAGIMLWSSLGTNLSSFCGYYLQGPTFGQPAGTLLDEPQIEFSSNFIYLTFNSFNSSGIFVSSTVARYPLTAFGATCSSSVGSYLTRTDNFTYALGQGATDTMYWDSNWYTSSSGTGTSVRIFFWQESSSSYTFNDKSIPAWNFFNEGTVHCASSDSKVTDWCGRLDPRRGTLFRSRAGFKGFGAPMLGMAWTAGPSGCTIGGGVAYPYVVVNYFLLSNLTLKQTESFYTCATSPGAFAVAYPSMAAPTQRGYVGGDFSYGGGTGGTDYYPSNFYSIQDTDTPNAPGTKYFIGGLGNSVDGYWGDYNTLRPWNPDGLHWMGSGWLMSAGVSYPFIFIFGRGRDHNAYLRWSTT